MIKKVEQNNPIIRVILTDYAFGFQFVLGVGEAVCHPNHKFSLEKGIKLATKRAYNGLQSFS